MKMVIAFGLSILWILQVGSQLRAQVRISESGIPKMEPHIAVNPTNPKNIIVATISGSSTSFRIGAYFTTDGGSSWYGNDDIVGQSNSCGDPVVAFDGTGIAYVLYQVRDDRRLYLQKSTDGGASWSIREVVYNASPNNIDRPWMAIDTDPHPSGYYYIHITVTHEGETRNRILYIRSTNGGASFDSQTFSGATWHDHGSYVAIGPDNEVHLAWAEINDDNGAAITIHYRRSTNGGASFGDPKAFPVTQVGRQVGWNYFITRLSPTIR